MQYTIGIIGLGYVGLPLARLFSTRYTTIGYDINPQRVAQIMQGHDATGEVDDTLLSSAIASGHLLCTTHSDDLRSCNFYIVAVPTPIHDDNTPDLRPLLSACQTVGTVIDRSDIVVFESTVYPGMTEDECIPLIEKVSGLTFNSDFYAGYSPERINPGDHQHTVDTIRKITSGSTPEAADIVDHVYRSVITAGTFRAASIRVAEAAKIIENTQRDVNIAFINELARIFGAMGIDTHDVLEAASTKWNFMPFAPGLVGGHCISVDPYYLIHKSQLHGLFPRLIHNARLLNDSMGQYIAQQVVHLMNMRGIVVRNARILILGIAFKENCPDTRNTKVADLYSHLHTYTNRITVYDPWVDSQKVLDEYAINITATAPTDTYDAIILAVAHKQFLSLDIDSLRNADSIVYDVKGVLPRQIVDGRL